MLNVNLKYFFLLNPFVWLDETVTGNATDPEDIGDIAAENDADLVSGGNEGNNDGDAVVGIHGGELKAGTFFLGDLSLNRDVSVTVSSATFTLKTVGRSCIIWSTIITMALNSLNRVLFSCVTLSRLSGMYVRFTTALIAEIHSSNSSFEEAAKTISEGSWGWVILNRKGFLESRASVSTTLHPATRTLVVSFISSVLGVYMCISFW